MTMTDPIADMLTRMRNANIAMHDTVTMPSSKLKDVARRRSSSARATSPASRPASDSSRPGRDARDPDEVHRASAPVRSAGLKRVSKPGLRVYVRADRLPRVLGGLGVAVLSTSQGLHDRPRGPPAARSAARCSVMSGERTAEVADVPDRPEPDPVPSGVEVDPRRPHGRRAGAAGPARSATCPGEITVRARRTPTPARRAAGRRAHEPGAARPHAHARRQHGDRRHRRVLEGPRDRRRRLPRHARRARASSSWRSASATRSSSTHPRASPSRCRRPTRIDVRGIDKELVGQVAADIRKIRKPEPYKGKGVRYAGEVVRRKAGKAGEVAWRNAASRTSCSDRRHRRVRKKVAGTAERPRLAVFRSNRHIVAQVIDDGAGRTIAAASTVEAELRSGHDRQRRGRRRGRPPRRRARQGQGRQQGRLRPWRRPLPRSRRGARRRRRAKPDWSSEWPSPSTKSGRSRSTASPRS